MSVAHRFNKFSIFYRIAHPCLHNSPPFIPILSQINANHALSTLKIHLNVIPPSQCKYCTLYLPFVFSDRNSTSNPRLPHACCVGHVCYFPHNLHNLKCLILDFMEINTPRRHKKICGLKIVIFWQKLIEKSRTK